MDDLYTKIVRDRNGFENLISRIPGFRGYMEMSGRREADRMVREYVTRQFQTQYDHYEQIEREIIRKTGIGLADRTRSLKTRLETLLRRIQTDTPGYSGFLPVIKSGQTTSKMSTPSMKRWHVMQTKLAPRWTISKLRLGQARTPPLKKPSQRLKRPSAKPAMPTIYATIFYKD